jgi:hypothetical protein
MLIENLEKSRSVRPRTAGKTSVEEKLVEILNAGGEDALNGVRDSRPWRWKFKLGKWQ